MLKQMQKDIYIAMFLSAAMAVPSSSYAGNAIGNYQAYMPVEEKALHGLSEEEWERIAGGDPVEQTQEGYVHKPATEPQADHYKYECTLPAGRVQDQIGHIGKCLGFPVSVWLASDATTHSDLIFASNHREGVLQSIIDHFKLNAKARIYKNQMLAFEPIQGTEQ